MLHGTIKKFLYIFIFCCYIGINYSFSQEFGLDSLDMLGQSSKYYKVFKENLYKGDEFFKEIQDKNKEQDYFRVFFNRQNLPSTIGYYTKKMDLESNIEKTELAQHVNQGRKPYYTIKYEYNQEDETLLRAKYFKDYHGRIHEYYLYHWDSKKRQLEKIEMFERTNYLNDKTLKATYVLKWADENKLESLSYYSKNKMIVERYIFTEGFNKSWNLKTDNTEYGIGNHQLYIGYLKRYDRFKKGEAGKRVYYVKFRGLENGLLVEKYNEDGVLVFEKLYKKLLEEEIKEEIKETDMENALEKVDDALNK